MMYVKLLLALTAGLLALPARAADRKKDELAGTWVIVSSVHNGKADSDIKGEKVIFENGTVTVKTKKKEEKAAYRADPTKRPKTIDITPEGEKEAVQGIYVLEGDTLKICIPREAGKRPAEFSAREGTGNRLLVLQRQKK